MIDYSKRLVEVYAVLNHLKRSDYEKIPKSLIDLINENKDDEYIWNYDESKDLKNQDINRDALAILSYINMKYLLNDEQKKFIQKIHNENQQEIENKKGEKYNPNDVFKNKKSNCNETKTEELLLTEYKKSIFTWIKTLREKLKNKNKN